MEECNRPKEIEWWRRRIRELNTKAIKNDMSETEYLRKRAKIFEIWEKMKTK